MLTIKLPWPPSVNTYWRRNGGRYFISKEGTAFKQEVILRYSKYKATFKPHEKLAMLIEAYPPDKRKRDIDNIAKGILDSLGKKGAAIYEDDSQIDKLTIWRCYPLLGEVVVTIDAVSL